MVLTNLECGVSIKITENSQTQLQQPPPRKWHGPHEDSVM